MKIARLVTVLAAFPLAVLAQESPRNTPQMRGVALRHFVIQTEHVLRPFEKDQLQAEGIEIQHVLPENRYLVRAADAAEIAADPRVKSVESFGPAKKIAPSAIRAALGHAFARVRLIFQDEVSFDDARDAVENVGGTLDQPLALGFEPPHRLAALIPSGAVEALAADERVFAIYGPPLRIGLDNSVAAQVSDVTPLYSAPYGLSGNGVVLSEFELAKADVVHPEFQGRLHADATFTLTDSEDTLHATHVAGTIMAAGLDPLAKGMSPQAQLHEFDANSNSLMTDKQNLLPPLNIVADNNSWGFQLGWQFDQTSSMWAWYGGLEYFGGYDGFYAAPYDHIAHNGPVLFVHSAGNDGEGGHPNLNAGDPAGFSGHKHTDDNGNVISTETFCYSKDGSGTDCPTPFCSTPLSTHCENTVAHPAHPTYGPYTTMGLLSGAKDVIAVGAVDQSGNIAAFSSRGPTRDGRVKPDLVAMGVSQYSTEPNNSYGFLQGTSMASPVVTGICGLVTEQWRKTTGGQTPTPEIMKVLLIAGAKDLGNPGPDYTYGFGLVDAKNSVDLIIADNNSGSRIRSGDVAQGQQIDVPMSVPSPQNVRVVLGWSDPEVILSQNQFATKTLVNDLSLQVTGPAGTVLPYVLDPANPNNNATTGLNTTDNVLEVEIPGAQPGSYDVQIKGTNIATGPTQHYVLVANAPLNNPAPPCGDIYKPNNTAATAFGPLASGAAIGARLCSASDLAFFSIRPNVAGPVTVKVTSADTPLQVTLSGNGISPLSANAAAGGSGTVSAPSLPPGTYIIEVAPAGTLGASASYTLTPTYSFTIPARRRVSAR